MHRMMAAAAVLAVVVIGGATLKALDNGSDNHSKSSSASKSAASATTAVPPSSSRDLHEISDPEVLRSRVESLLRAAPAPTAAHRSTQSTSVAADGSTGASTERSKDNAESSAGVVGTNCLSSVRVPAGATPSVLADATFDGAPAVVVVAHDGPRILIYVLAKNDCRLLTSQFLKE